MRIFCGGIIVGLYLRITMTVSEWGSIAEEALITPIILIPLFFISVHRLVRGVIGSSMIISSMNLSLYSRFVAAVSSSNNIMFMPASIASEILAAILVEPLALSVWNFCVFICEGRFLMKTDMSTPLIILPSSALTYTASGNVTAYSRPSPGMWG